jgi:hypothetical protein
MQQTAKAQWKALWSAFRTALGGDPPEGYGYVHPDVAAVQAAAEAVASERVRAGFALRHAGRLVAAYRASYPVGCAPGAEPTMPRHWRGEVGRRLGTKIPAGGYGPAYLTRAGLIALEREFAAAVGMPPAEACGAAA